MRVEYWIAKVTNTHSEYAVLLEFSRQQWLRERASVLRYTYIVCLVRIQDIEQCMQNLRILRLWRFMFLCSWLCDCVSGMVGAVLKFWSTVWSIYVVLPGYTRNTEHYNVTLNVGFFMGYKMPWKIIYIKIMFIRCNCTCGL